MSTRATMRLLVAIPLALCQIVGSPASANVFLATDNLPVLRLVTQLAEASREMREAAGLATARLDGVSATCLTQSASGVDFAADVLGWVAELIVIASAMTSEADERVLNKSLFSAIDHARGTLYAARSALYDSARDCPGNAMVDAGAKRVFQLASEADLLLAKLEHRAGERR